MATVSAQAGISGKVIDLHGSPWRPEPRSPDDGQAKARAACCPSCAGFDKWACQDCARYDRWVYRIGGRRYAELCAEARQQGGPASQLRYLNMCMTLDEGRLIDLASDEEQAAAAEGAGMVRELVRRLDAAAAARRRRCAEIRLAEDQAAVDALLNRSAEVALAMDELRADPRVARILDAGLDGPALSSGEVTHGLLAAMGLAHPQPGRYEESLPPVGDLARSIGVRP